MSMSHLRSPVHEYNEYATFHVDSKFSVSADQQADQQADPSSGAHSSKRVPSRRDWFFASLCLVGMLATWIAMAELLQAMQTGKSKHYDKPVFETYFIHGSYVVLIPIWAITALVFVKRGWCTRDAVLPAFSWKRLSFTCFLFSILSFISAVTWYLSLSHTVVAANTVIYQSASVLVYVFALFLLGEKFSILKSLAVAVSLGGVALIAFESSSSNGSGSPVHSTAGGYVAVVISTVCYAIFETCFKRFGEHPKQKLPSLYCLIFLGFIGLSTAVMLWPVVLVAHYSGLEVFQMPSSESWKILALNASLDCIFNILLIIGISLTSPIFISVGTMLIIPLSAVVDKIVHNYSFPDVCYAGIVMVVCGFVLLNTASLIEKRWKIWRQSRSWDIYSSYHNMKN